MLSALQPHFIGIGHVSFDVHVQRDPRPQPEPGGAVMFGALTALGMSLSAGVITAAGADYPFARVGRGVAVKNCGADETTTFEAFNDGRHRGHRLVSRARSLGQEDVPEGWKRPEVLLVAPLAGELPADCAGWFNAGLSCAVAQGWMRRWNGTGEESIEPAPPEDLATHDVIVVSDAEVPDEAVPLWRSACRVLAVTRGDAGVSVYDNGQRIDVAGFPAKAVDSTGAGDVWAAAFSTRLLETGDAEKSAVFANAAASLSVERVGLAGVPQRGEIELRMAGH